MSITTQQPASRAVRRIEGDRRQLHINMPEEVHRAARIRAAELDGTLPELIEAALRLYLDMEPNPALQSFARP